ncbi:MAG: pyruvate ferredoxin oxidoreductase [Clostridia bacterium]|nr:transketolase C-terminal domain-containing protein [Lachnospiraceae bacterium]NCB99770.1 pyruvate ferredoxin oxidoreductase [Clostridia bacterium]NCD04306.1 pyruvate ferredoxin oxidoreductase [Clostridia bacterium]
MAIRERLSGNEAVATAMRQINPDVMAAFPITPSTEIPQYFSSYVANGKVDTVFVPVESEHSAMSAVIGAEAAGVRAITATSSCGMALMWELLYVASSSRLPLVMALVNRALSAPININCDHSDSMGARDAGWIQIYSENSQEAYDNMLMAYRIAEHKDVRLPVMICQDGFIISHGVENIVLLEDDIAKKFVGEYHPEEYLLNSKEPLAVGPYATAPYFMESRRAHAEALKHAKKVILDVADEFEKISGRKYGFFETYKTEDADYIMIVIGSAAGAGKDAVDILRNQGIKAGVLKIRMFRPFPAEQIAEAVKNAKVIACMDRAEGFNTNCGPIGSEVKSALYDAGIQMKVVNYVYGLGGRDVPVADLKTVFEDMVQIDKDGCTGETYRYLSVRE